LVAVPVLLGSLAGLPMGILTDRFGGRVVFAGLLAGKDRAHAQDRGVNRVEDRDPLESKSI
jgi:hypothetical protein